MTVTEFRAKHSELIAYYQYIEMRLKGICAALPDGEDKGWLERLDDFDLEPMGRMIQKIRTYQKNNNVALFSEEDLSSLDSVRESRNYWVHQCFVGYTPVTFGKGLVKKTDDVSRLESDFRKAVEWDDNLARMCLDIIRPVI